MPALKKGTLALAETMAPATPIVTPASEINLAVAGMLRDYADLLQEQGEDGFRWRACRRAADVVAELPRSVDVILAEGGREGLVALPTIGQGLAAAIAEIVTTGHWSQLDRLRGELVPEALFRTIPGIGRGLARQLVDVGQFETLEELEHWVNFGGPEVKGFGPRRKRMIAAVLAERLGRRPFGSPIAAPLPPLELLLKVDEMYRERSAGGKLRRIAPRRFNPSRDAWLPIMHARHDGWHFTALHSNTRLAHELGKTRDWVVIYHHRDGEMEGRSTVVTETLGPRAGQRVVRGRENESTMRRIP
jgi:hypothetical protein